MIILPRQAWHKHRENSKKRCVFLQVDEQVVDSVLQAFEQKGALNKTQAAALRKLSGTKRIVKGANILQSWSFMDRLSTHAADTAADVASQRRREKARPKSPVRKVSQAEAKRKFDDIRIAQEDFAHRMEQERLKKETESAREATFVPMQTPAPPLARLPGATQTYLRPPSPEAGRQAIAAVRAAGEAVAAAMRVRQPEPEPEPELELELELDSGRKAVSFAEQAVLGPSSEPANEGTMLPQQQPPPPPMEERSVSPLRLVRATMDSARDADTMEMIDSILLSEEEEQAAVAVAAEAQQLAQAEADLDLARINPEAFVDRFLPATGQSGQTPAPDDSGDGDAGMDQYQDKGEGGADSSSSSSSSEMMLAEEKAARIRRVAGWIALQEFEQRQRVAGGEAAEEEEEEVDFVAILRQRVEGDLDQDWGFIQGSDVVGAAFFKQELQHEREALFGVGSS